MERILTGIQSSGVPHLGNVIGAMMPAITLSNQCKEPALFFIADLHALTTQRNPEKISQFAYATAAAWLACGFDADRHFLYRQSHIPEVCELMWYLNCLAPFPMLANAHSFKDKSHQLAHINAGLFTYPVLMAADILLYNATHVPVGKDQKQHLEIARDIAQAFNQQYAPLLTIPEPRISEEVAVIPGTDGRKMSKSYKNTLEIFASEETLTKSIMGISTDSASLASPKNPEICPIFNLYQHIASPSDTTLMKERYLAGGYGYHAAKKELLACILSKFEQKRKSFAHYINAPQLLEEKLLQGEEKARNIAQSTLKKIRIVIGTRS